jgi:Na+/proline symporter
MFYQLLKHLHSINRWFLLLFLIASLFIAFKHMTKHNASKERIYLMSLIFAHTQLILGFILYFISPMVIFSASSMQNRLTRFYLVEHITLMLISIVLITIAYSKYKKRPDETLAHKKLFWLFALALVILLIGIPWPFMGLAGSWI